MRDTDVGRVRSVEGVGWAVPLYRSILLTKLRVGTFKQIQLVGLDSATMVSLCFCSRSFNSPILMASQITRLERLLVPLSRSSPFPVRFEDDA